MFAWQNNEPSEFSLPELQLTWMQAPYAVAKFDLTLYLKDVGDQIVGGLEYASALFDQSTVERHLGYLHRLLAAMVENEHRGIDELSLLPEDERHQLVVAWNATAAAYPSEQCIHELFEAQVARTPITSRWCTKRPS